MQFKKQQQLAVLMKGKVDQEGEKLKATQRIQIKSDEGAK